MLSKKSFGIAGAAMLGTVALLGTNAANAAVDLSGEEDDITFAMETVTETVDEGEMYHQVTGTAGVTADEDSEAGTATVGLLDIAGPAGVGAPQDTQLIVTYTLDGMVFGEALNAESIELYAVDADGDFPGIDLLAGTSGERSLSSGGGAEDSEAVFSISANEDAITTSHQLVLRTGTLGVSSGGGTASMTVAYAHGQIDPSSSGPSNAVQLESGAVAKGTKPIVVAVVERGYTDFGLTSGGNPVLIRSLGRFSIDARHRHAGYGTNASIRAVFGADSGSSTRETALAAARVEFSGGMTDFAEHVWLEDGNTCGTFEDGTDVDLIDRDEEGNNNGKLVAVTLGELDVDVGTTNGGDGRLLCIEASGRPTRIPATGPFDGKVIYQGEDALEVSATLGRIARDGTTIRLPYLTKDERYNQRIILVNESNRAAAYTMTFATEDGIVATPGADASGTLPRNTTTVLHMLRDDVVSIEGDGARRVAAEIVIEADSSDVSVATNQTNRSTGSTDTVVYEAAM